MSRQLVFWKYNDGIYSDNQKIYDKICNGESVNLLDKLPIEEILKRTEEVFHDWDKLDDYNYETSFGYTYGGFSIEVTEQSVIFDCNEYMFSDDLNRVIDIMLEFGCPLYDPQISVRFDQ